VNARRKHLRSTMNGWTNRRKTIRSPTNSTRRDRRTWNPSVPQQALHRKYRCTLYFQAAADFSCNQLPLESEKRSAHTRDPRRTLRFACTLNSRRTLRFACTLNSRRTLRFACTLNSCRTLRFACTLNSRRRKQAARMQRLPFRKCGRYIHFLPHQTLPEAACFRYFQPANSEERPEHTPERRPQAQEAHRILSGASSGGMIFCS